MNTAPSLIKAIEHQASSSNHRISTFIFEGKTYIIKKQRHGRSKIGYAILTALTKLLFMPALQGIHVLGGKITQDTEIRRLKTLSKANVLVPQVIYENELYFVMSYMGDKNFDFILKSAETHSLAHWEHILKAMVNVHKKGTYLSQAFSRNMILHESQEVAFIDFEDDPGTVMTLTLAQARDWLLCILSTCWRLPADLKIQSELILSHLSQEPTDVQEEVLACASKIASLRFLFRKKKPYKKRDLQSFKCLIDIMYELRQLSRRIPSASDVSR